MHALCWVATSPQLLVLLQRSYKDGEIRAPWVIMAGTRPTVLNVPGSALAWVDVHVSWWASAAMWRLEVCLGLWTEPGFGTQGLGSQPVLAHTPQLFNKCMTRMHA